MAGDDDENDNIASQPGSKPKIRRKQFTLPKPIAVPDSSPRTPPHENGQRTPKPTGQLKENAPAAGSKPASAKRKAPSSKQKRAAPSPSTDTSTPKKPRQFKAKKNATPSNRVRTGGDISYWSSSRRNSDTNTQHPIGYSSDLEDDHRPEQFGDGDIGAEDAYQYGPGDDDAEDEYTLLYDGDDQGAKMRRY